MANRDSLTRVTEPNLQIKQSNANRQHLQVFVFAHDEQKTIKERRYHESNAYLKYSILSQRIGTDTATAGDTAQAALLLERARDMWAELKRETDLPRTQQLRDSLG